MSQGLVHLYCGTGKGKTTAAMGLAVRALGHGRTVIVLQFAKDGTSGEVAPLCKLGATVLAGRKDARFTSALSPEELALVRARQDALLRQAIESDANVLVLDEACFAVRSGLVDEALLRSAVLERPPAREVVLTGRDPAPWMLEAADYVTRMECERHPFERGITAREGVEY